MTPGSTTAEGLWEIHQKIRAAITTQVREGRCTQLALSAETGISQAHISNMLSGVRRANVRNLDELASAAGIRITAITLTVQGSAKAQPKPPGHPSGAMAPGISRESRNPVFEDLDRRIAAEEAREQRAAKLRR